ncbi:putative bifunctional diguanylate cyclase/phosphodiesterase [Duganella sp. CT11-25]|uniref:putative bifunctional diguanylate cyclase/phosphodiesterase n=1 Tax=unclassified Duganella TaxID=2636909 RepID=UPI0039AF4ED1
MTTRTPNVSLRAGPLGSKVARSNMLVAGAALSVAGVLLVLFQYIALRGALLEDLLVQARIAGNNSTAALLFRDQRAATETLAGLALSPAVDGAAILDPRGEPLASYRRAGQPPPAASAQLLAERHHFSAGSLEVLEPIRANGEVIGHVVMRATLAPLHRRLASFAGFTVAVALASLALAWLLVTRMRAAVRSAEQHLHYLAHVDPVTALPNRNEFNERLSASLKRADRQLTAVSLLLLDLDNFKVVNDTLGHNSGDLLLQLVAQRLRDTLREHDVICRIGGDEFVVIIEAAEAAREADAVARKILLALAAPFSIEHQLLHVSASIGMAAYPAHGDNPQSLMRGADTAMYHAKNLGKNGYQMFRQEMTLRAHKRLKMEANLRRALQNDELTLHYQPQIDVRSGRMTGFEVLTRWTCPELGPVSPAEFIAVAEDSGVIVPLGRWVLRTACRQAGAWHRLGLLDGIAHVAVNLSARQTCDTGLMDDILALLAENGLPPQLLELELTEGAMMENVDANLTLMQRIQDAGIHLSIDDFGTGYSSMAYLKRFPIDQLKIDRSFVSDVPGDGAAIAIAIIALAHSLDLSVVAEGVENAQQMEFLREAGCDTMQGYYFSRPVPAPELEQMLRARRQFIGPAAA